VNLRSLIALGAVGLVLAGCSFENKYEKEADKMTHAVMADNLDSVKNDLVPNAAITRSQLAEWSDELSQQGKLESIKEVTPCQPAGYHCFDVKFEKHMYTERLLLNDQDKIVSWRFHIKDAAP
jgi:hypothetical protein